MQQQTIIETHHKTEVINVTAQCQAMIEKDTNGIALFSIPHTTAAILIAEDDEELREDIKKVAENWLAGLRPFQHLKKNNPNAEAHIFSTFVGTSVTIPLVEGQLMLGTYQNILLLELDGPKKRNLQCTTIYVP